MWLKSEESGLLNADKLTSIGLRSDTKTFWVVGYYGNLEEDDFALIQSFSTDQDARTAMGLILAKLVNRSL